MGIVLIGIGGAFNPSGVIVTCYCLMLLDEIMKEAPDMNKLRMLQTFDVDYSVKDPQSGMTILHHGGSVLFSAVTEAIPTNE
ncbi:hypothetical protein TGRH88_073090 [Toxoplasma gondii]|uniref:Uncharacterized protein n=1 Tax=Toxoplasma gondii TaxID=5811 RepID=A0A7J6K3U9_TOXGO|nr:hypothetical protein TGRH88_073090 [Toxoplasma gondii]